MIKRAVGAFLTVAMVAVMVNQALTVNKLSKEVEDLTTRLDSIGVKEAQNEVAVKESKANVNNALDYVKKLSEDTESSIAVCQLRITRLASVVDFNFDSQNKANKENWETLHRAIIRIYLELKHDQAEMPVWQVPEHGGPIG